MKYLNDFIDSIMNFDKYSEFKGYSKKRVFNYIIILTIFLSCIRMVLPMYALNSFSSQIVKQEIKVPPIELKDGALEVRGHMPIFWEDKGRDKIFIIDTSGSFNDKILKEYNGGIFIDKDKLVFQFGGKNISVLFKTFKFLTLDNSSVINCAYFIQYFLPIVLIFYVIIYVICVLLYIFVMSLLLQCINLTIKRKVKYSEIYNITTYGSTVSIFVIFIANAIRIKSPYLIYISIALSLIYGIIAMFRMERRYEKRQI